jgi:hypothetical protein
LYGTAGNGPGALIIFEVPDPSMGPANAGVAVSAGTIQNVKLKRLFTMDEVKASFLRHSVVQYLV